MCDEPMYLIDYVGLVLVAGEEVTSFRGELSPYGMGMFYLEDFGWSFVPDKKFTLIVDKPRVHGIITYEVKG